MQRHPERLVCLHVKPPRKVVRARAVVAVVVTACMAVGTASAKSGDLDRTYGRNGRTSGFDWFALTHTASAGPGRAVTAVGNRWPGPAIATRYTRSGARDPGFGKRGVASFGIDLQTLEMAVASDGRTAAVGWRDPPFEKKRIETVVAVLTARGRVDTVFGGNGYVRPTPPSGKGGWGHPTGAGFQPDGKLVVGIRWDEFEAVPTTLQRYARDGSLDLTFGSGGHGGFSPNADIVHTLEVLPDGKIVTGGQYLSSDDEGVFVARFLPDGGIDPTFGTAGRVRVPVADPFSMVGLHVDRDGSITTASSLRNDVLLMTRHAADGTPVPTFGTAGIARRKLGRKVQVQDVAFDAEGGLFVLTMRLHSGWSELVTHFASTGIDRSFGHRGTVYVPYWQLPGVRIVSTSKGLVVVGAGMSPVRFLS